MKTKLINFLTTLKAEHIKKRGTGFYWTSVNYGINFACSIFYCINSST